jgi:hypothetical protein
MLPEFSSRANSIAAQDYENSAARFIEPYL